MILAASTNSVRLPIDRLRLCAYRSLAACTAPLAFLAPKLTPSRSGMVARPTAGARTSSASKRTSSANRLSSLVSTLIDGSLMIASP
jgi:hypothetical protein